MDVHRGVPMDMALEGLICSFQQENGFGVLELEDGREVLFDVTACVDVPVEGQPVRVVLGRRRNGMPRAVLVEPASHPESTRPVKSLPDAIRRLQAEGIALELDGWECEQALAELSLQGHDPAELTQVLLHYYRDRFVGERRQQSDLFIAHAPDADVCAFERELTALLGGNAVTFASSESLVGSLDAVVDAFNEELRSTGDARRIVALVAPPGQRAYFCMALTRAVRLSAVGVLKISWDRPHLTPSEPPPRFA